MDSFDPYEFDSPTTYALKTGDSSRGVTLEQALPSTAHYEALDATKTSLSEIDSYSSEGDPASSSWVGTIITMVVAALFVAIGISSIL